LARDKMHEIFLASYIDIGRLADGSW
jgi:hypothetical protein